MFPAEQPKRRILFVDDEPLILEGLQRMLPPCRQDWDMTFVDCDAEALAALAANPFDVTVTGMRMPHMDGGPLLAQVKERFPRVIRIVLSGYFERDEAPRAAGVAHRYVAKPREPAKLRDAIERCCDLSLYGKDDATIRLLGAIGELPSMPNSCASLLRVLDDPDVHVKEIGPIVGQDVATTAKVLQLVNSAFFGPSNENPGVCLSAALLHDTGVLVLSSRLASDFDRAKPGLDVRSAVYIADTLAQEQLLSRDRAYPHAHDKLDMEYLAELRVPEGVPAWRAMAAEVCGSPAEAKA